MNSIDLGFRLKELTVEIKKLKEEVNTIKKNTIEDDLWDNSDIIRNWNVSTRTLSTWRTEGLIKFVQVGSKIWYPKSMRDEFLNENLKNGGLL